MSHPNAGLLTAFYSALQRRDAAAMNACYAPDIRFRDAVFDLVGWRARAIFEGWLAWARAHAGKCSRTPIPPTWCRT